jgi:hypothetical protein
MTNKKIMSMLDMLSPSETTKYLKCLCSVKNIIDSYLSDNQNIISLANSYEVKRRILRLVSNDLSLVVFSKNDTTTEGQ